jgi:hypothetical protein
MPMVTLKETNSYTVAKPPLADLINGGFPKLIIELYYLKYWTWGVLTGNHRRQKKLPERNRAQLTLLVGSMLSTRRLQSEEENNGHAN